MRSRIAILAIMTLLAASCGARLTPAQRAAGIGIRAGNVSEPGVNPTTGPIPGQPGGPVPTVGPSGTGGPIVPGGGPGGPGAVACTSSGKADDIGVTPNAITVAVASDVSGPQPGLFRSTWQAMGALVAYTNDQGGICGRRMAKPLYLDTQANSNANRAAVLDACQKAFALVGSMSAFDEGGAGVGASSSQCKGGPIPDLSAITVNGKRTLATNVYPAYPVRPDYFMIGTANFIKERYPQVIKKAARLYLNAGVAKSNSQQRENAYTQVGFKFIYRAGINIPASGLNGIVNAMKKAGVEYVTYVGDYQTLVQLQTEMKNQQWFPTVRDWDSVAYSSQYLSTDPEAVEGSLVFVNTALLEEYQGNQEMQLYMQYLARTAPGAKPDYFGLYAWSAGRLFVKAAIAAGGQLTRKKLFEEIKKIHAWDAYGLHGSHDTGNKMPTGCFAYVQAKGGRFVRFAPATKLRCDKLIKVSA
jgi:ABC-type branched-subunit amino acid transport system substrate-binding protein